VTDPALLRDLKCSDCGLSRSDAGGLGESPSLANGNSPEIFQGSIDTKRYDPRNKLSCTQTFSRVLIV